MVRPRAAPRARPSSSGCRDSIGGCPGPGMRPGCDHVPSGVSLRPGRRARHSLRCGGAGKEPGRGTEGVSPLPRGESSGPPVPGWQLLLRLRPRMHALVATARVRATPTGGVPGLETRGGVRAVLLFAQTPSPWPLIAEGCPRVGWSTAQAREAEATLAIDHPATPSGIDGAEAGGDCHLHRPAHRRPETRDPRGLPEALVSNWHGARSRHPGRSRRSSRARA